MSGVSEPELSEIYGRLQEHVASGGSPLGHLLHNPGDVLRAVRAIAALPVLEARFSAGPDGRALRAVFREGRVRFGRWEHRAVVVLPDRVEDVGSGRPNRTLRRQVRHATAAGLRCETVDDPDERRRLVALADEWERSQPGAYRNPDADNGDLVRFDLWLAVYSAEGLPLLLSVAPVDGGWGCVRYFRTLAPGPARTGRARATSPSTVCSASWWHVVSATWSTTGHRSGSRTGCVTSSGWWGSASTGSGCVPSRQSGPQGSLPGRGGRCGCCTCWGASAPSRADRRPRRWRWPAPPGPPATGRPC